MIEILHGETEHRL